MESKFHEPVMVKEVLTGFKLNEPFKERPRLIDATLGTGGHSSAILKSANVLGIEADALMFEIAKKRLSKVQKDYYKLHYGNFRDIDKIARSCGFGEVHGVLFDLGVSSLQLASPERGFSFSSNLASLDMRIDRENQNLKASDLLNLLRKDQLIDLFLPVVGRKAYGLAKRIVERRKFRKFESVSDFLEVTDKIFPKTGKIRPETKAFLALRMAVNSELENLSEALPKAFNLLVSGGRLIVISFHSGEDRIVKNFYRGLEKEHAAVVITKEALKPKLSEVQSNPRSRSARLRILEKI